MRRIASIIAALAFAASLSGGSVIAKPHHGMHGNSMNAPGHMKSQCPRGQHWVKPYRRKNGTWVRGYCR
jgi:hypothetical protein